MSKPQQPFTPEGLSPEDAKAYAQYLHGQEAGIHLPPRERRAILHDLSRALLHLHAGGLPMQAAALRLGDVSADFYRMPAQNHWYPLDSAAKVYPLSMTHGSMSVFRVSAYLRAPVKPEILQVALLSTIKRFPLFATTIRRGFFWHYLDATRRRFAIQPERTMPCQPIHIGGRQDTGFRVVYFDRRISLELFHILTDGHGAMMFLKALVGEYLRMLGTAPPMGPGVPDVSLPPLEAELRDDFGMGGRTETDGIASFMGRQAAQLAGRRTLSQPTRVLHMILPAQALHDAAKTHDTTVTGLVLSAMFLAGAACIKRPRADSRLHIQVPVNMRKFYPSRTLRNFSMYSILRMKRSECTDLSTAIPLVDARLRRGCDKAALDGMMEATNRLVRNPLLRYTPLVLKRAAFRLGYPIGERSLTTTLSNLGVVPDDFGGQLEMLDFVLGPSGVNNANCALITHAGRAVLTITKSTPDPGFEQALADVFTGLGLSIEWEEASLCAGKKIPKAPRPRLRHATQSE